MSEFDKIHTARLAALADHLETAETLKVGTFYFGTFYSTTAELGEDADELLRRDGFHVCGTAGCAIGEAAALWPEHFKIQNWGYPAYESDAKTFFGITAIETDHLFFPGCQDTDKYGGKVLFSFATRYEVAANIRAFLEYKAREEAAS